MKLENTLRIKLRTLKKMYEEHERGELVESEIEDLHELSNETHDLVIKYSTELGAEEIVKRLGQDHWLITDEDLEDNGVLDMIECVEKLL